MLLTRIAAITIATTVVISVNSDANATEPSGYNMQRQERRHQDRSFYGGDGLPTYLRGIGTYAGSISAVRAPYNGIYFAADGSGYPTGPVLNSTARPRIIHVNKRTMGAECSYESGVCIIRGR